MQLALPWRQRKPRPLRLAAPILQPYTAPGYWHRHRRLFLTLLGFFAFFYGAFFGITTIYLLVQMAVPLVILALLVIWLLPETGKAPVRALEWFFFAFMAALMFWPDYLALAIPGLPWITALRLTVAPLAIAFLLGLSQSRAFRSELKDILNTLPIVWKFMLVFAILGLLTTGVSPTPMTTANRYIIAVLNWILIFFVAGSVLARPGRVERLTYLIWYAVVFVCLIAVQEARHSKVPWAGHIPSFLKVEDPVVQEILSGSVRSFIELYRVQSKFTTPIGLAEFLACALPFIIYIALTNKHAIVKSLSVLTLPLMIYIIIKTDARLGNVGMISTAILYTLLIGIKLWKASRTSIIGPAIVFAMPFIGFMVFLASFFVYRVRKLVWGTGQQLYSNDARHEQWALGTPKILEQPWGHGLGQGGVVVGYYSPGGLLTIDSYYLSMLVELGVLGFIVYFGMFVATIYKSSRVIAEAKVIDDQMLMLGTITISLANFVLIKSVVSQMESHPLMFAVLGGAIALLYRVQQARANERMLPRPAAQAPLRLPLLNRSGA